MRPETSRGRGTHASRGSIDLCRGNLEGRRASYRTTPLSPRNRRAVHVARQELIVGRRFTAAAALHEARLFVRSLVPPLLSDWIRVTPRKVLLDLLEFFERRVFLEVGHL